LVIGGDGAPLLLVHGWPQFWYQFRLIMPALARHFEVIASDQRGRRLTDKPPPGGTGSGYDSGTLAEDLAALMDALGHRRFTVVGCDTGMDIAYALASDHRDRGDRLAVAEDVLPGVQPSLPLFLPSALNEHLFHLTFNRLPAMNVQLVHGREDVFFGFIFDVEAFKKLPASRQGLHRQPGRQPPVAAWQLRVLPGTRHRRHHRAEPAAREEEADPCPSWRSAERKAAVQGPGTG
jgi:pimeloyl-ACP methyl ester carboxylesterase